MEDDVTMFFLTKAPRRDYVHMQLVEVIYLWWYVNQDGGCGAGEGGDGELSGEDTQAIADL